MKSSLLVSIASLACATLSLAAEGEDTARYQMYPKNLARQHLGTNLLQFNTATNMYVPTQAAAAWLDDDVTTGWPLMAEKQYYLVTFQKGELLTNFSLSTRSTKGTVSLYASDTAAAPGAATWTPLLRDAPLESVNEKMSRAFSRVAKYVLIETEAADPGPVYSIYLYSHKPAVAYEMQKRERVIEPRSIFGPYVNEATSFNTSGLYAHSTVTTATGPSDSVEWQKAIDDNPETFVKLAPSGETPTTVHFDGTRMVSRVALLTDAGTKGQVDIYLNHETAGGEAAGTTEAAPTMSMVLDGTTPRLSVDFPATQANEVRIKWTPKNGTDSLALREFNTFGDANLSTYAVNATSGTPAAIADQDPGSATERTPARKKGDLVDWVDSKDAKDKVIADPVAQGPSNPYLPGALGFSSTQGLGISTLLAPEPVSN